MLGQAFVSTFVRAGAQVLAPTHSELDITDELAVRKLITKTKPHYIVNCIAHTNVDGCESDPAKAYLINAEAVDFVSTAAKKVKAKFIHIGTDYVFDGSPGEPRAETDAPNPIQVYGKSKLEGDLAAIANGGTVFRVQWLFGNGKANFIDWVAKSIVDGKRIPIAAQQAGSPSSTLFVANIITVALHICKKEIYHVSHDNYANRLECAQYIADFFKKDSRNYFDILEHSNFGTAARPTDTRLSSEKLKKLLCVHALGSWQSDVLTHLTTRYNTWNP